MRNKRFLVSTILTIIFLFTSMPSMDLLRPFGIDTGAYVVHAAVKSSSSRSSSSGIKSGSFRSSSSTKKSSVTTKPRTSTGSTFKSGSFSSSNKSNSNNNDSGGTTGYSSKGGNKRSILPIPIPFHVNPFWGFHRTSNGLLGYTIGSFFSGIFRIIILIIVILIIYKLIKGSRR